MAGLMFPADTRAQSGGEVMPDTLRIHRQDLEARFLRSNLQLLAAHYNVLADSALIRQAGLIDNPVLSTDQNVYSNKRFFEHYTDANGAPQGQVFVQVQQLITLGGKRHNNIRLAKSNAVLTRLQFVDLLRSLRQQLRMDFYTLMQLRGNEELYQLQLQQLEKLQTGVDAQFQAGNVARKDVLRVQALQVSTQQEMAENGKKVSDIQAELRTLLGVKENIYILPIPDANDTLATLPAQQLPDLIDLAKQNNSAYKIEQEQLSNRQINLAYQKSLAVPDLTVAPSFDQNSNYTKNYWGLGLSVPIPLLNRNQGNIRSARYQIDQERTSLDEAGIRLQNDVQNAYQKLRLTLITNSPKQREFYANYAQLYNNVVESYTRRQISLLEFVDYFRDYEEVRESLLRQQFNIHEAQEELNYQVGIDVVQ
jgi:cobalt-zinc-cadmium efflux system outer membrane protein